MPRRLGPDGGRAQAVAVRDPADRAGPVLAFARGRRPDFTRRVRNHADPAS